MKQLFQLEMSLSDIAKGSRNSSMIKIHILVSHWVSVHRLVYSTNRGT